MSNYFDRELKGEAAGWEYQSEAGASMDDLV